MLLLKTISCFDNLDSAVILELVQESQVIFEKQGDIGNAIFSHSKSIYAKAKGPAGIFFAVYPHRVNKKAPCAQASPMKMS